MQQKSTVRKFAESLGLAAPSSNDAHEELTRARAEQASAEAAYKAALLTDDPKAQDAAQAGVAVARRAIERAEAHLAEAAKRDAAKAERVQAEANATARARVGKALADRAQAAELIAQALASLAEGVERMDAADLTLAELQSGGHLSRNLSYGLTFGGNATRARLRIEFDEIVVGRLASRPEPFAAWVAMGNATAAN